MMNRKISILFAGVFIFSIGTAFYFFSDSDKNKIKIILFGDSITKGNVLGLTVDQTFASQIKTYFLKHHFTPIIINAGISGETSDKALERLEKDVISQHPDIVVIMYGTNDAFVDKGRTIERLSLREYKMKISEIIIQIKKANIRPVLMTPLPMVAVTRLNYEPYSGKDINFYIKPYVAACREIADKFQIPLIDNFRHWEEKHNMGINIAEWLIDGVHPNEAGHVQIARTMFPVLIKEAQIVPSQKFLIRDGKLRHMSFLEDDLITKDSSISLHGSRGDLYSNFIPESGNFIIAATFTLKPADCASPAIIIGNSKLVFNSIDNNIFLKGNLAGNDAIYLGGNLLEDGKNNLVIQRDNNECTIRLNEILIYSCFNKEDFKGKIGFEPEEATFQIYNIMVEGNLIEVAAKSKLINIPLIDLSKDDSRQVIIDKEKGQYLGHPTTVLLDDQNTILTVYPKGHGKGEIVLKKSNDTGLSWSERLPVPESWKTSLEVPTLYRINGIAGNNRLVLFSGLYPIRIAHSEDNGESWSELEPVFNFGGIVAMSDLVKLKNGAFMALFHDDGSFYKQYAKKTNDFIIYKTTSPDGLEWSDPEVIIHHKTAYLCEGGIVRSPDGNTFALLMRENSRVYNSMVTFSNDEGDTWSPPVELPASLTGDRHTLRYSPDGRIVVVFRDMASFSQTQGDFVAWVGTWNDIAEGREGEYRIRLLDNKHSMDCGYPGLEVLSDGTFIATTYGHWEEDEEPYIKSIRFSLDETDALIIK